MSTFYVQNFGCRATQADGAAIEQQMRERGWTSADRVQAAQLVVLNTCTVTASADADARAAIRRVRRENPGCRIVVTGCYAQRAPAEVAALAGVDLVVGNSHKHRLGELAVPQEDRQAPDFVPLELLQQTGHVGPVFVSDIFAHTRLLAAPVFDAISERTRPNLKIQDGCDNRCSFCVIPSVRGQSRSLPRERVLREIEQLAAGGYREVVISGINLGRWGRDLEGAGGESLTSLLRSILDQTTVEKLRISSVEPMDWTGELIALAAGSERIAKHAHVPMQSGSDRVLRRMHRKYRPWHYREKIARIRGAMPEAAIGADVMVGFPGESDDEFAETLRFIEELPLTYLHVFSFSARPGTPAATMPAQVPEHVTQERSRILREAGRRKRDGFEKSFVGRTVSAITLGTGAGEASTAALTDNYMKIAIEGRHETNQWHRCLVTGIAANGLEGRLPLPRS